MAAKTSSAIDRIPRPPAVLVVDPHAGQQHAHRTRRHHDQRQNRHPGEVDYAPVELRHLAATALDWERRRERARFVLAAIDSRLGGVDPAHQRAHRRFHPREQRPRIKPHQEHQRDERRHHRDLARAQVGDRPVDGLGDRPEHHALIGVEHVERAEDEPGDGDFGGQRFAEIGAEQDQELADEPVEPGQPDRREHHHHEHGGVNRDALPQAPELGNLARVTAQIDHPDQQKQPAGRDAVVEHLVDRAFHSLRVERENSEHHEAQVADRGVGDQAFQVRLHHRDQRAVDDSDHREGQE